MSSLDPKTKLKAAQAKVNGVNGNRELPPRTSTGIYTSRLQVPATITDSTMLNARIWPAGTQFTASIPKPPKVKKGCGQRKNKRDKAGRALHAEICRINQRYPGADVATIRAQLRSGQLDR